MDETNEAQIVINSRMSHYTLSVWYNESVVIKYIMKIHVHHFIPG
jgi:hypothetical protein